MWKSVAPGDKFPGRREGGGVCQRLLSACSCLFQWVGGRYSLWSAIGLSIALHVGECVFCLLSREMLLQSEVGVGAHVPRCPPVPSGC